jgi:hypothetical protein
MAKGDSGRTTGMPMGGGNFIGTNAGNIAGAMRNLGGGPWSRFNPGGIGGNPRTPVFGGGSPFGQAMNNIGSGQYGTGMLHGFQSPGMMNGMMRGLGPYNQMPHMRQPQGPPAISNSGVGIAPQMSQAIRGLSPNFDFRQLINSLQGGGIAQYLNRA